MFFIGCHPSPASLVADDSDRAWPLSDNFAPCAGSYRLRPVIPSTMDSTIPEVIRTVPLQYYVLFATLLFAIGVTGVLLRRNAIIIFMCIELMLNAVNILLTAFSAYRADPNGQIFVFFIMAVAAAEVAVGLGIIVMIYRNFQNTDVNLLSRLKW
jgi:NADH-quinone oxidoreductase subunit K